MLSVWLRDFNTEVFRLQVNMMVNLEVKFKTWLHFIYILGCFFQPSQSVCRIDPNTELRNRAPLLLHSGNTVVPDGTAFLVPKRSASTIVLYNDEEVLLLCAGEDNRFVLSGEEREVQLVEGSCISDSNFSLDSSSYFLEDIKCTQEVESSVRHFGSCSGGNKRLQIGYPMSQNEFLNLIDICFNENTLNPIHLNYTLVEGIERRQNNEELDNPDKTNYFNSLPHSPHSYYSCSNQQNTVGNILGSHSLAREKIVCTEPSNFLVKTHLAPSSDFVYQAQQNSVKYYINTIPMWKSITNGNWEKLEEEIRLYASNTSRAPSDLVIYTGTLGVTTLPDNGRTYRPLYLAPGNKIPVPQWVWKVVYEPRFREAIVFILVNNPYHLRFAPCSCVCPQTKWTLAWNRGDRSKGYIYCCTVENFRSVYPGLPDFQVTGLLTKNRPYDPFELEVEPQK